MNKDIIIGYFSDINIIYNLVEIEIGRIKMCFLIE